MKFKKVFVLIVVLSLIGVQSVVGSISCISEQTAAEYQQGANGNIEYYYQLIDELDHPTGANEMDLYILGIVKGGHSSEFIEKYFGSHQYSGMLFVNFCVKQNYTSSVKEIFSRISLLDDGDDDWDHVGINEGGKWVFPFWTPFWFLITAFEEQHHDMIDLIWPEVEHKYKAVYAAEFGDLEHFSDVYEKNGWDDEVSKIFLKECLSNAFASRKHDIVDYLLRNESFEPVDVLKAAVNGGCWTDYREMIEQVDISVTETQELLEDAIYGCDYRIIRDLIGRGAKLSKIGDIQSLLRTGIPELIHIGLAHINDIDNQLFLGLSNAYGPFSGGIGSWDPVLKNGGSVYFIGITQDVLEDQGVMKLLSGIINPGSNDTFPRSDRPFSWEDVLVSPLRKFTDTGTLEVKKMEHFYQTTIAYAKEHHLPYLGICGGSQHLILHHGGYIQKVDGHLGKELQVALLPGSISHYLAMTDEERSTFCRDGQLPSLVIERVKVAHNYAAVEGMLGFGIDLGGVSEYDIPETFSRGLWMVGCQFHPEGLYDDPDMLPINRNKQILDSYLDLCLLRKSLQNHLKEDEMILEMDRIEKEVISQLNGAMTKKAAA